MSMRELQSEFAHLPQLTYKIVQANNSGSTIEVVDRPHSQDSQITA